MPIIRLRTAAFALCIAIAAWTLAAPQPAAAGAKLVGHTPARILIQSNPSGPAAPHEVVVLKGWVESAHAGGPKASLFWSVASVPPGVATIRPRSSDSALFQASRPGIYAVTVTSGSAVQHLQMRVYGRPAAVTLTPFWDTLVADGQATDTIQVQVVDRRGVPISGFVGDVELMDSLGQFCHADGPADRARVHLNEGQGSVTLCAQSLPADGRDYVTSADLEVAGFPTAKPVAGIRYGAADVHDVPATAARLVVAPLWGGVRRVVARGAAGESAIGPTYLGAQQAHAVTLSLAVEDAAGVSLGGARPVTVSLTGPGSFSSTALVKKRTLNYPGDVAFAVYSEAGQAGMIGVSARAPGLPPATYQVQSVLNTAPAHLLVLVSRGLDDRGMPYNLYDVLVVDAHRQPDASASGMIEVSDDSAALGTADPLANRYGRATASILYAPGSAASDDAAYQVAAPGAEVPFPLVDGSAVFAIETGAAATVPAHLTISDPALGLSLRPGYAWATGRPVEALLTASQGARHVHCREAGCRIAAEDGQPVTLSAQITDGHGNPVDDAGLPVLFSLWPATAASRADFTSGAGGSEWSLTNAHGVASVVVSGSTAGSPAFVVAASFNQRVATGGALAIDVGGAGS